MNIDSEYYKEELIKTAHYLKGTVYSKDEWEDDMYAKLEKKLVVAFYFIRKLFENNKITNRLMSTKIRVEVYESVREVTILNNIFIEDNYNLNSPKTIKIKPIELCHQFIHSFTLLPQFYIEEKEQSNEKILRTIFFVSKDKMKKKIYSINIDDLIELLKEIGNNYPQKMSYKSIKGEGVINIFLE